MTSSRKIYIGLSSAPDEAIVPAGILKLTRRGVVESGEFAYGKRYLASPDAFALNPDQLPLADAAKRIPERRLRDGGALPLTFRDALPDSWGRRVLEAQYGKSLDDIDVLLMTNADRVGAMVFAESLPMHADSPEIDLIPLEAMSDAIEQLEHALEIPQAMRRLLQRGGSLGGARPKASFVHENRRWIAKFPALGDDHNVELLEACILDLAAHCGIEVSPYQLKKIHRGHALLLLRFDREGEIGIETRIHYLSASALLGVPYESNSGSYVELAQVLRRIAVDPAHDLNQLYRRMVFNLIIDNTDDHVKNHGALHVSDGHYRLAPAFDVVMQLTNTGYQELAIMPGNNNSKISLAIAAAPYFGINDADAKDMIEAIEHSVHQELLSIIDRHGGDNILRARVQNCLQRQQHLIHEK